jgi:uncharacterized protein (TIGR02118 family)
MGAVVIKQMTILTRMSGMTRAEFAEQWEQRRVPAIKKLPGVVRYIRNLVMEEIRRNHVAAGPFQVDGIEEIWYASAADAQTTCEVMDFLQGMTFCKVQEHVVINRPEPSPQALKRISLLARRSDMSPQAFRNYWLDVHAPLALCHRAVDRYVQNHVMQHDAPAELPLGMQRVDGFGEFMISDLAAMQDDYNKSEGRRMTGDVQNFLGAVSTYLMAHRED